MDARLLARFRFLLLFLNLIAQSSSTSQRQNDYVIESAVNLKSVELKNRFERFVATSPTKHNNLNDPAMTKNRRRSHREVDLDSASSEQYTPVTERDTLSEQGDSAEKYDSLETDMPSSSTSKYESSTSEVIHSNDTVNVIPLRTTEKVDDDEVSGSTKTPGEIMDLAKLRENSDIESFSHFNHATESTTPSVELPVALDNIVDGHLANQLGVVGISETKKHAERIMTLPPPMDRKYVELKENVHEMLAATKLKRETEDYLSQLHERYDDLPLKESDNAIWTKYSRAVVESFVLDFCRNYPNYTTSERSIARWYKVEEYKSIYNATLLQLQHKRSLTAVQFAAPVRRAADIFKAILDTPVGIVQSKCGTNMLQWMCFAEYVVRLADISETCDHIWYHAKVHLTVLQAVRQSKGAKNPAEEVLDELDSKLATTESNNDVGFLFDLIIQTLSDLAEKLKDQLLKQVSLYRLVTELQREDKLNCLKIDEQGW